MHNQPPFQVPGQPPFPNDPNQQPDSKHQRINTIWKVFALIYVLAALGLSFYWEIKDTGLAIVIRELQGSILGDSYYPALDVLCCLLALLLPLILVKFAVEKITGVKIEKGKSNGLFNR